MDKEIEILAKRKIALESGRISDEMQSEISVVKVELLRRGFSLGDGPSVTKLHHVAKRNVKKRAEATYKAYKDAFAAGGVQLSEAVLRECASKATPHYDNATRTVAQFVRNQCHDALDIDSLVDSLNDELERDRHKFLNQIEIECAEARLKIKPVLIGELPKLLELPKLDGLQVDLTQLLKTQHPLGVLFIDLDGFKALNDHQGHDAGNVCLETIVAIMGDIIVGRGRLYRPGGDEFIVVLHNSTLDESAATAERIRTAVDRGELGGSDKVTVSIGVASSEQATLDSAENLVKASDEAMYGSKYTTKNRVVKWPLPTDIAEAVKKGRSRHQNENRPDPITNQSEQLT
jgi:diguanylate cyclase (GGDEF)-like protein